MAMTKQFVKTQWNNDREPAITAEQLNRMEKGIDTNENNIISIDGRLSAVETEQKSQVKKVATLETDVGTLKTDMSSAKSDLANQSKAIADLTDKIGTVKFTVTENGLLNVQEV